MKPVESESEIALPGKKIHFPNPGRGRRKSIKIITWLTYSQHDLRLFPSKQAMLSVKRSLSISAGTQSITGIHQLPMERRSRILGLHHAFLHMTARNSHHQLFNYFAATITFL
ncbi:hypothetical protein XELAEV_18012526mg [Xenopus laevis]|uniref:Uncharacterized protein n=1 Tax=Xenopus laevis TaxID=8355 RepID=A0A974DMR5_XENLA|nr:hypothetical protein XELAEV_18012526mg [Xenopus laevis]